MTAAHRYSVYEYRHSQINWIFLLLLMLIISGIAYISIFRINFRTGSYLEVISNESEGEKKVLLHLN